MGVAHEFGHDDAVRAGRLGGKASAARNAERNAAKAAARLAAKQAVVGRPNAEE
jgi:hypothetical protein